MEAWEVLHQPIEATLDKEEVTYLRLQRHRALRHLLASSVRQSMPMEC